METRSKSSRSSIWRYFEPIDFRQTKCLLCDGTYRNSGNTTNLIDHLKRMHPEEYDMVMELISKQPKECAATLDEDTIAIANIKFEEEEDNNNTHVKSLQIDAIGDRNAADVSLDAVIITTTTTTTTTTTSEQAIGGKQAVESSGGADSLRQIESTLVELDEHNNNNNNNIETSVDVETSSGQTTAVIAQIPVINGVVEQAIETHEYQICKIVPLPHARSEVWSYFGFVADDEGTILDRSKVVCKLCQSAFCYSGNTTNFYSHLKSMHSEVQLRSATGQKGSARGSKRSYASFATNDYDDADDDDADGGDGGGGGGGGGRGRDHHQDFNENNNSIAASTSQSQTQASSSSSSQHYSTQQQQQQQQHLDPIPERSRDDLICVADITDYIIDFIIADCRPIDVTQGIGFRRLLRLLAPGYQLPERHRLELAIRRKYDEMRKRRELEENSF